MDITELTKNFKTYEELQLFCSSQFKQILNLSKKIKELEDKLAAKPKEQTSIVTPLSLASDVANNSSHPLVIQDDAKTIAQVQLRRLKEKSFGEELTLDETKRVEIFNKILNIVDEKPKTIKADAKTLNTTDLLSLVESSNGTEGK